MKSEQFGYHLTLDLYKCPKEKLENLDICYDALIQVVKLLDMKALISPYLVKAESNEDDGGKDPGGITGYVIIAESHVSIHTFPKRGFVSIDAYSCKVFDYDIAKNFFKKTFEPEDIEEHRLDRGTKYPQENIY